MRSMIPGLLMLALAGCGTARTGSAPQVEPRDIAGKWQGWLVTERSFALYNLDIKADGTFEVTGQWTWAQGVLIATDGGLRFDGTGAWRGTLVLEQRGRQSTLRLERDDRLVRGYLHPVGSDG